MKLYQEGLQHAEDNAAAQCVSATEPRNNNTCSKRAAVTGDKVEASRVLVTEGRGYIPNGEGVLLVLVWQLMCASTVTLDLWRDIKISH